MKFTKMQGLGNDYVYVNCFQEKIENPSEVAIKVSNRNFGVGSDGLIMINPSKVADFEMEMWNADGTRSGCAGEGLNICDECGLCMAGEMNAVFNFRIDTIFAGLKLRL